MVIKLKRLVLNLLPKLLATSILLLLLYQGVLKKRLSNQRLKLFNQHLNSHPNIWIWEL